MGVHLNCLCPHELLLLMGICCILLRQEKVKNQGTGVSNCPVNSLIP